MSLEDFTTYTEHDPGNHITLTAHSITHAHYRNRTEYVVKDFGAGHFGDFEHLITVNFASGENWAYSYVWVLANSDNDVYPLELLGEKFLCVLGNWYGGTLQYLRIRYFDGSVWADDYFDAAPNTTYYLTLTRAGTTLTCKVYSDSGRTNLVDTLTLTVTSDAFRYMIPCSTYNSGNTPHGITYINDLYLQEAVAANGYGFVM